MNWTNRIKILTFRDPYLLFSNNYFQLVPSFVLVKNTITPIITLIGNLFRLYLAVQFKFTWKANFLSIHKCMKYGRSKKGNIFLTFSACHNDHDHPVLLEYCIVFILSYKPVEYKTNQKILSKYQINTKSN